MSPFPAALLIVAFVMNVAHAEDSLGRLFLTPEQRHELDALREPNAPPTAMGLAGALPAGTAADRTVVVNGVVRRSRGSDVVWVNGARAGAAPGQPVQLRRGPDKNNRVTLQDAEGAVGRLKPGQFWDPATGRVANCFGCTAPHKTTDLVAPLEQAPVPASAAMPPANAPPTTPP